MPHFAVAAPNRFAARAVGFPPGKADGEDARHRSHGTQLAQAEVMTGADGGSPPRQLHDARKVIRVPACARPTALRPRSSSAHHAGADVSPDIGRTAHREAAAVGIMRCDHGLTASARTAGRSRVRAAVSCVRRLATMSKPSASKMTATTPSQASACSAAQRRLACSERGGSPATRSRTDASMKTDAATSAREPCSSIMDRGAGHVRRPTHATRGSPPRLASNMRHASATSAP